MTLPTTADTSESAPAPQEPGDVLRVERGQAGPEELAAVTAVLLARAAAQPSATSDARPRPGWRRLEREPGFRAPHSWRAP